MHYLGTGLSTKITKIFTFLIPNHNSLFTCNMFLLVNFFFIKLVYL